VSSFRKFLASVFVNKFRNLNTSWCLDSKALIAFKKAPEEPKEDETPADWPW